MKATRLFVLSRNAGSVNPQVEAKLRKAFTDHLVVDFDPKQDLAELVTARARVVVGGGDGTVEFVIRKFADMHHPIGVIPLGTFNNLARALRIPTDLDGAIKVAREGRARSITLGRVNEHIFVEACALGLFGDTIALGDEAKDLEFGKLAAKLKEVIVARRFRYELDGDIDGGGSAMSLVFSNTATIGMQLPIGDGTPTDPRLEFSVHAGRTRADIIGRAVRSALPKQLDIAPEQVFRFSALEVTTRPRVRVYADNRYVSRTPAKIEAVRSGLRMLMPK
jgi:diacylglycerol kinase family enzyme